MARTYRDLRQGERTLGTRHERPGDFWAQIIADIVLRIGFFIGTALVMYGLLFGGRHRYHHHWDWVNLPQVHFAVLAISTLSAIFGPFLYRKDVERGRGSLDEVRRNSRRD